MWTFLSNHGHVLVSLRKDPDQRARDLAAHVGITERAVRRILHDLVEDGYIVVEKQGRRNHYLVRDGLPMRHPLEADVDVGELLEAMCKGDGMDEESA